MENGNMVFEIITKRVYEILNVGELVSDVLGNDGESETILTSELLNESRYVILENEFNNSYTSNAGNELSQSIYTALHTFQAEFKKCNSMEERGRVYLKYLKGGIQHNIEAAQKLINSQQFLESKVNKIKMN